MTRKEAIKIIQYARNALDDKSETAKAYDMALNSLKVDEMYNLEMENAEAFVPLSVIYDNENRWIPVSERLPEDEQEILFSTKTGRVHDGKYYDDNSANPWYSHRDKARAWSNVVNAWMPLPELYKAESED